MSPWTQRAIGKALIALEQRSEKTAKVKETARFYLDCANPGPSNACSNIALHGQLFSLLDDKQEFSNKQLDKFIEILQYRLDALAEADELAKIMGVVNDAFDAYSFNSEHQKKSETDRELYTFAWRLLVDNKIMGMPAKGHSWPKPYKFLSACLATSGLGYDKIRQRVEKAVYH